jgi:hypothetical protein
MTLRTPKFVFSGEVHHFSYGTEATLFQLK